MQRDLPIGLFDSGIGGLTVLRALRELLPREAFVYVGDTARVPYGNKSPHTVIRYSQEIVRFLQTQQIKLLVVACNTSSALALPALQAQCDFPVIGLIPAGAAQAVAATQSGVIGVIGTAGTIASGAYERAIQSITPTAQVVAQACPLLVPLVEEGWVTGGITDAIVRQYVAPMLTARHDMDVLILGCTHYPLLAKTLQSFVGTAVRLVDPGIATAQQVLHQLATQQLHTPRTTLGATTLYVTDQVQQFSTVARLLFSEVPPVQLVEIPTCH